VGWVSHVGHTDAVVSPNGEGAADAFADGPPRVRVAETADRYISPQTPRRMMCLVSLHTITWL
jgi:hypothetical protein